jgi:hypothetical protein
LNEIIGKTLIILVLFRILKMMISLSEGLGQFFKILMLYDVKVKNKLFGERLELIPKGIRN